MRDETGERRRTTGFRRRGWIVVLAACACLAAGAAAAPHARAQPAAATADEDEGLRLYRQGVAHAQAGRWKEAEALFERVVEIRAASPVLLALAQAQVKNRKLASAARSYRAAIAGAGQDYGEVAAQARAELEAIAPRIPRLVVHLPVLEGRAEVTVDGRPVDPAGVELDEGRRQLVVRAAGRAPFERSVQARESHTVEITVRFAERPEPSPGRAAVEPSGPEAAAPPAEAPTGTGTAEDEQGPSRVGPLVLGGVGVVALVAGTAIRLGAQSDYDGAAAQCSNDRCPSGDLRDSASDARSSMLTGTIVAGAGAIAVAGAAVWWVSSGSSNRDAPAARTAGVRILPARDGAMAVIGGAF
jgi:hypothetical protein